MKKGLLRFLTAGSVDDGKSTLIGRLLFESHGIFADQLQAISRASQKRNQNQEMDLSLLTDGLEAEREQGITIDVAYRYFSTPKRKFIIADTPGHEQYTRNMVTGASTADAMILLLDASKMKLNPQGSCELLSQTKRHSKIARLLKIQHVIVAVNKMDLVNYDPKVYDQIVTSFRNFADSIGLQSVLSIPLSALHGDNIVKLSAQMPWYQGPPLLELLENLEIEDSKPDDPFRFPVQMVLYHKNQEGRSLRGYMGRIASGQVKTGDSLLVLPSGHSARVKNILTLDGSLQTATTGQSVTLVIHEDLDISRGDMLANADRPPALLKTLTADLCWLSEEPLKLQGRYWLKHTTKQTLARVTHVHSTSETIKMNDIARVTISTQQPLSVDDYDFIRATGSLILIDEVTYQTAAAGMIRQTLDASLTQIPIA